MILKALLDNLVNGLAFKSMNSTALMRLAGGVRDFQNTPRAELHDLPKCLMNAIGNGLLVYRERFLLSGLKLHPLSRDEEGLLRSDRFRGHNGRCFDESAIT